MEDNYSLVRQRSGIWRSLRDGDFEEEEVWDVLKDRPDYSSVGGGKPKESFSAISVLRPLPTAARMIPRASSSNCNSSNSFSHEAKVLQQSAPVSIPDWSKIYKNKPNKSNSKNVSRDNDDDDDDDDDDEEEEDGEYDPQLPPHEFIARRLARSQISSFSVFEGVGRTLKGRDLSKVRNAVLTKTGFLESL